MFAEALDSRRRAFQDRPNGRGDRGGRMGIIDIVVALIAVAAVLAIGIPLGRRALLGWYVHEVRRTEVAEAPDEAIVTYPLA